jgi:hypothetical protein
MDGERGADTLPLYATRHAPPEAFERVMVCVSVKFPPVTVVLAKPLGVPKGYPVRPPVLIVV